MYARAWNRIRQGLLLLLGGLREGSRAERDCSHGLQFSVDVERSGISGTTYGERMRGAFLFLFLVRDHKTSIRGRV